MWPECGSKGEDGRCGGARTLQNLIGFYLCSRGEGMEKLLLLSLSFFL